jgi:hypothetical protein
MPMPVQEIDDVVLQNPAPSALPSKEEKVVSRLTFDAESPLVHFCMRTGEAEIEPLDSEAEG